MKRTLIALVATLAVAGVAADAGAQGMGGQTGAGGQSRYESQGTSAAPQRQGTTPSGAPSGAHQAVQSDYRQAQQLLKQEGYYNGPVDGKWGRQSRAAVTKYQQDKGLRATGALDAQTMAQLGMR